MIRLTSLTAVAFVALIALQAHAATLSPSQVASTGYGLATYQMDGGSTSIYVPPSNPPPVTGGFSHSSAYGGSTVACLGGTIIDTGGTDNTPPSGFYSNPGAYCADFSGGGLIFSDIVTWHYYSNGSPALHTYSTTSFLPTGFCVPGIGCANGGTNYTVNYGAYTFHSICSANYGTSCSAANSCGVANSGTYSCSGACSATAPALPANYGKSCTVSSDPNSCGMTNTNTGTIGCSGTCSASKPAAPSESLCAPTASCTVSPSSGYEDHTTFTYTASATGGAGSYTYNWSGTDGLSGNTKVVTKVYSTTGTKTASVLVTSNGKTDSATCTPSSVTVNSCTPSLSASPTTISEGQTTTLTWSVPATCASSCVFSDGHTGGSSGTYVVTPPAPTSGSTVSYTVTCPSGSANTSTQVPITVIVPTVDIKANGQDSNVRVDQSVSNNVSISWTSANATSCTITRAGSSWKTGLSSAGISDSVTRATTYTADCVNGYGTHGTDSITVDIIPSFNEF